MNKCTCINKKDTNEVNEREQKGVVEKDKSIKVKKIDITLQSGWQCPTAGCNRSQHGFHYLQSVAAPHGWSTPDTFWTRQYLKGEYEDVEGK